MGWFDEDDDDEEEEEQKQQVTKHDDDEEEDPLDAYMKTLESSSTAAAAPRRERLDLDNEEEATSHWKETTTALAQEEVGSEQAASARQALQDTFHSAAEKKQQKLTLDPVHHDEIEYPTFEKCSREATDTREGHVWRQEHQVTCTPGTIDPITSFDVLEKSLREKIMEKGYTKPTLVQSQTLPAALSGRDCLVSAKTGSGKTLAYVWPMVMHIQSRSKTEEGPMAIVLVPTRELALQVHKQVKIMLLTPHSSVAITGGISNYHLLKELKRNTPSAVVATPGRFLDIVKQGLSLQNITVVVLDEADKMLAMGFTEQVSEILKNVRPDRQTIMTSATIPKKVEQVAKTWLLPNVVRISVGRTGQSSSNVDQHVMVLPNEEAKQAWMMELLPVSTQVGRTLVFMSTKTGCEELAQLLREHSMQVDTLHGDKHQVDRNSALRRFSNGKCQILVATDVASRGLDIPQVATVINYDPPKNLDIYVHRIGRAGRLSKKGDQQEGVSYTLLTPAHKDFALVLQHSFERDGRVVSDELKALAEKSNRKRQGRPTWSKAGLGYTDEDTYGPSKRSR